MATVSGRLCPVLLAAVFFYALMSLLPAYASADITHNLVGWWKFDEGTSTNAHDSSGYGNNGTMCTFTVGVEGCGGLNSAGWVQGKFGSAFSSTAAQPRLVWVNSSTTASQILNATSTGAVAAWIKLNSYQTWQIIACKEDGSGTNPKNGYCLKLDNSSPSHIIGEVSNGVCGASCPSDGTTGTMRLGVWTHVAMTWDHNFLNIYINGVIDQSNYPMNGIGASSSPSTFYTKGT